MYKVINRFQEKNHNNHVYEIEDVYPAKGQKLVKARADFLTKTHPEYGVAFLEEVEEEQKKEDKSTVKKENDEAEKSGTK